MRSKAQSQPKDTRQQEYRLHYRVGRSNQQCCFQLHQTTTEKLGEYIEYSQGKYSELGSQNIITPSNQRRMDLHQRNSIEDRGTNQGRPGKKSTKRTKTLENPRRRPTTSQHIIKSDIPTASDSILTRPTTSKKTRRFQRESNQIVNLSKYQPNKYEISLLEKGLNFIPTPIQEHEAKIVQDFLLFERKLRLYHKLHKNEEDIETTDESSDDDSPHKILKPSKGWKPDDSEMDPNIMRYKTCVLNDMQSKFKAKRRPRFNTTKHERKAIGTLRKNTDIIIKPADKVGAIVIMDKTDYIKEGERQLQQKQHYMKLDNFEKTKNKYIKEVEKSLRSLKNREYIDDDIFKILFRPNPRTSNLNLLPKIHKKNNPGRPIINSVGSLTETISALVDEILRKYSKLAKSYIKDTSHFLQEIQNIEIHHGDIIATVDVTALYTNIPHQDGIHKVKEFLKRHNAPQAEITLGKPNWNIS